MIERRKEPYRRIACAEWVPPSLGVKEVVQPTSGMVTLYPGGRVNNRWPGMIIDRNRWQRNLLESLRCDVHLGETVLNVVDGGITTDKGTYYGKWVIGADGPLSVARRALGIEAPPLLPALNAKMSLKTPLDETIVAFFPPFTHGYAWCFPRGDLANVGVGMKGNVKAGLAFWVRQLSAMGLVHGGFSEWAGGLIPVGGLLPLIKGRTILVGDAGGFIDPLTGAGIAYACDSGRNAARVVREMISPEVYEREMSVSYRRFFDKRKGKRRILEARWETLEEAVKSAWIAFSRG